MSVEVAPVSSRSDVREFIELPFRLHSNAEQWVPPLRIERRLFLSRRTGAFFRRGEAGLFLARRDGRVVGRISAQVDTASRIEAWSPESQMTVSSGPSSVPIAPVFAR